MMDGMADGSQNAMPLQPSPRLAVVGGGITGLMTAYYAIKNGQPASSIDLYEASGRLGGKIETQMLNGQPVNKAAEFIDSDQTRLLSICNELNEEAKKKGQAPKINLLASDDQGTESYQRPNGQRISGEAFHAAYAPLARRILADKEAVNANPTGALAQQINAMSLQEYFNTLTATTPVNENPSFFQRIKYWLSPSSNQVAPEVVTMAMQAYASESGQPPERINALQFLHEASSELGSMLDSDCAWRVEGGTEKIIEALRDHLKEQGVNIQTNSAIKSRTQQDGKTQLNFVDPKKPSVEVDKAIFALPAYTLAKIDGLGLNGDLLTEGTQYTNSVKFTIKLKDGVVPPKENFFSSQGFQVWSAMPGQLTFLSNADKLKNMSTRDLVAQSMQSYAQGQGMRVEDIFDVAGGISAENTVFNNPGKSPCYASPAPGQALRLEHLRNAFDTLAEDGIGIAGTYLPVRTAKGTAIGFMECGLASAEHAVQQVMRAPQKGKWVETIVNQRQLAANDPEYALSQKAANSR